MRNGFSFYQNEEKQKKFLIRKDNFFNGIAKSIVLATIIGDFQVLLYLFFLMFLITKINTYLLSAGLQEVEYFLT